MKRFGIPTLLALCLLAAIPVQAADAPAAPVVLTVVDEAAELASLGAGEVVYASLLCQYCPAYPEDCLDESYAGLPCSEPEMKCSCNFCGGDFGCFSK